MSDLPTLLPSNAQKIESDLEQFSGRFLGIADPVRGLWDVAASPLHLLPYLAWAFSVDEWDSTWSEDTKRSAIAAAIEVHRRKGTIGSVRRVLAAAGFGDVEVRERFGWDDYDGSAMHDGSITHSEPDHWAEYRIFLKRPITIEQAAVVRAILETVAPARAHLKALDFTRALNTYNARISHDGEFTHGVA